MDCTWVKSLRGIQVGKLPRQAHQGRFMVPVVLNRERVNALIDMNYGHTLVRTA